MDEDEVVRFKRLFEPDLKRLDKLRGKLLELGIVKDQDRKSTQK